MGDIDGQRDSKGRFIGGNQGGGRPKGSSPKWNKVYIHEEPKTETEVRERFRILNELHGLFQIELSQEGFPDYLLRTKGGRLVMAEAERSAAEFKAHRHDPDSCDLIICWKNNWKDAPLPVLEIRHLWYAYRQLALLPLDILDIWKR